MEEEEHVFISILQDTRTECIADYVGAGDGWIEAYVNRIKKQIKLELSEVEQYLHENAEMKGSMKWKETTHTFRRRIALHHQEMELIQQGVDIPLAAVHVGTSIANGNRYATPPFLSGLRLLNSSYSVNRRAFRQLYGF